MAGLPTSPSCSPAHLPKNLWSPLVTLISGMLWLVLKSIRRLDGECSRATMRIAPDCPKRPCAQKAILCQVISQAGMPFTSSNITVAKPGGCQCKYGARQAGIARNSACRAASAQAV